MKYLSNPLLSLSVILLLGACNKNNDSGNPPAASAVVYVAGYESNGIYEVAKYWKDGTAVNLTNGTSDAEATAVFVSGTDVYVAGWETQGSKTIAKYWKNNVAVNLTNGTNNAAATSLFVSGSDVYVAGFEMGATSNRMAKYWKNGTAVSLAGSSTELSIAKSITVSGTIVYVAGIIFNGAPLNNPQAITWKNGIGTILSTGFSIGSAYAVFANAADVYVAGYTYSTGGTAKYWKNGTTTVLPSAAIGTETAAFSIFVKDNNVYASGYEKTPAAQGNIEVAKYWKNGVATNLSNATHHASGDCIYVVENDIYVAGYEENTGGNGIAKYWKNNAAVNLTNGLNDAAALSIAVN